MEKNQDNVQLEKKKYRVPAVDTAFKILSLLSRKKYYKSNLTEIAKALSLNPTTCYRILQQLVELSVVRYEQHSKRYSLGPYMIALGDRAKESSFDISLVLPYLERLSDDTGMTSVLVSRIGRTRSTIIAKAEGRDFGVKVSVGRHFFVADGAYGECFLSYMEEEEADDLLRMDRGLRTMSEQEIMNVKNKFPLIRRDGYTTTYGEYINGIFGVGAPLFNSDKTVEMVICLFGMTAQMEEEELTSNGELLKSVADEISTKINGYEGQPHEEY